MSALVLPLGIIGGTVLLSVPLGRYMAWVMEPSSPGRRRAAYERFWAHILGLNDRAQDCKAYSLSLLTFNLFMFLFAFLVLGAQQFLPLNPDGKGGLSLDLVFHTAASFTSNTNLQHYSGEVSLSYFSQLFALTWLQFVSAATGIAALAALSRALGGKTQLGNFYADLWRAIALLLLPLSFVLAVPLVLCGVPMTLEGAAIATTLEGVLQIIARGPVAAMVAIKQLGTNGGGFFGPNSAHPFENPTFLSNILSNVAILLIPMASVWMFGRIAGRHRHAVVIFSVMLVILVGSIALGCLAEAQPTRAFAGLPVEAAENLEGKELRFGAAASPTWAVTTTATSNGSVNSMHDSLNPLTGLLALTAMWLNVAFGGVGVGFINMFLFIIVTVFLTGMMVGRTPEYLTRKVDVYEMKLALLALLLHPLLILGSVAVFAVTPWGLATIQDVGSHGLSEIIYEFTSAAANNGSGFEGLTDNTIPWNVSTGVIMIVGRYVPIIIPLAIAASLARKRATPETQGTFRVDTALFGIVLLAIVLIVGALMFFPLAVLGPVAEHLSLG